MLRAIALGLLIATLAPTPAHGAGWRWPVQGQVVTRFSATAAHPFAAGRHRGIAIAATPGAIVRAACQGRVAFAGSVGPAGPTLSVRCGTLRATYQGLGRVLVHRGQEVKPRAAVALAASDGLVHLGARIESGAPGLRRYVDPLTLLAADRLPRPLGPAPRPRLTGPRPGSRRRAVPRWRAPRPAERTRAAAPHPSPVPVPPPAAAPSPSTRPSSGHPPLAALVGLGLLALAAPSTIRTRTRRHRRPTTVTPVAAAVRR